MKKMIIVISILVIFPIGIVNAEPGDRYPSLPKELKVNNVILCIGDGMGLAQVFAARVKTMGKFGRLAMERMPVTGLVNTCSADALITDSGAAGTALAAGVKTNNGMIGMDPDGRPTPTILEACKKMGMATGLVATSTITHATPASFASHVLGRSDESAIAVQLLQNRVNVLLGGGWAYFIPASAAGSKRTDKRDLIKEARKNGYAVARNKTEFEKSGGENLLGLFEPGALTGDSAEPTLAGMTRRALELLSRNEKGFFLMVEGSQIDWAGHGNDLDGLIKCVVDFDEAVQTALEFAARDSHTVVVVTADHETGGLGIVEDTLDSERLQAGWLTKGHTAVMTPLFAFGPGVEVFTGVRENAEIPELLSGLLDSK
jgi:alkaline phosphatase